VSADEMSPKAERVYSSPLSETSTVEVSLPLSDSTQVPSFGLMVSPKTWAISWWSSGFQEVEAFEGREVFVKCSQEIG